jgi:lactate dehydrogenase-like 2-hydroxyacid dehydrogenase
MTAHGIPILQYSALQPSLEAELAARYAVERIPAGPEGNAFLLAEGKRFVGYVASVRYGLDTARMDLMPNLRVASFFGVGLDAIESALQNP